MSRTISEYFFEAVQRANSVAQAGLDDCVEKAIQAICQAVAAGKPLLICGNGGSASDAAHITGELVGRFLKERKAINAICLSANTSVLTAWGNDYSYDSVFARQVEAHGSEGAVLWGISTSGNSKNVVHAMQAAHAMKLTTIGLTGEGGGKMAELSDILVSVPLRHTPYVQEAHICLYHFICEEVERRLA